MEGFLNEVGRNNTGKGGVEFSSNWRIFYAKNDRLTRGLGLNRGSMRDEIRMSG